MTEQPPTRVLVSDASPPEAEPAGIAAAAPMTAQAEAPPDEDTLLEGAIAPPAAQLPALIEALLFVADGPVEEAMLARTLGVPRRQIDAPLVALAEALRGRGLRLQRGPDGAQLVTAPLASIYVEQFLGIEAGRRLSTAALETLAIIAYRQPVTRGTLEAIRGVSSDGALDTLRARGLVDAAGRADTPGRPALFATTQKFLEYFGLERPEDLPALPDELAALATLLPERGAQLPLESVGASSAAAPLGARITSPAPEQLDSLPLHGEGLGWGSIPSAPTLVVTPVPATRPTLHARPTPFGLPDGTSTVFAPLSVPPPFGGAPPRF